jgi:translation initiation factor 3 subunit A
MASIVSSYNAPDQALKAAEDFRRHGKDQQAFDALYNFMAIRKPRQWSLTLEKIMQILIELSLQLKKYPLLRDPLNNYKHATQYTNIASLETTLNYFSKLSEEIFEKASQAHSLQLLDVEDLENEDVEDLLVGSINPAARADKDGMRGAWRILWETYKIILEVSSKNKKLEDLYVSVANKIFDFCKTHKRRLEFKRICEQIRSTLRQIRNTMDNNPDFHKIPFVIDLANVETNDKQLAVRFSQLQYCYHFELWQEALKTLEDINFILQKRGAPVKSKHLADYFENLAKMFWKSEFYLYHTVAYFHHYSLITTKQKSITPEEVKQKSTLLVLAILAIPPLLYESLQTEDAKTKTIGLLSSDESVITKNDLLSFIQRQNILDLINPDVKTLFKLIQDQDDVFSLAKKGEELLTKLKGDAEYTKFIEPIRNVIIYKLLGKLSKIYKTLKIERFVQLIGTLDFQSCTAIIHLCNTTEFMDVKIDHLRKLIIFSDSRKDLHNISMGITNMSDEIREIASLIDEQRENTQYLKNLEHFQEDAKSYIDNASTELKRRFELIGNMKNIKEIKPLGVVPQTAAESAAKKQEVAATVKTQADTKRKDQLKKEATKRLDELTLTKKMTLYKDLQALKGIKVKGRKLEEITQDEVDSIKLEEWEKAKENYYKNEKDQEERQNKKLFNKYDYIERARRQEQQNVIVKIAEEGKKEKEELLKQDKENFEKRQELKKKLELAQQLKQAKAKTVLAEREKKAREDLEEYKIRIAEKFRESLLVQAQEYLKEAEEKKAAAEKAAAEEKIKRDELERKNKIDNFRDKDQDTTGFTRNTQTRSSMQAESSSKPITRDDKKPAATESSGIISRGPARSQVSQSEAKPTATPDDTKKKGDTGFMRRNEPKEEAKAEPKKDGPPKFVSRGGDTGMGRNTGTPTKDVKPEAKPESKFTSGSGDSKFAKPTGAPPRFANAKKQDEPTKPSFTRTTNDKAEDSPPPKKEKKEEGDGFVVVRK